MTMKHTPAAARLPRPEPSSSRFGLTTAAALGSSGPGTWWSTTTTSTPACAAASTGPAAATPQSTVTIRPQPRSFSAIMAGRLGP